MPQMAPMSWLFLYIMFTIIFMIFNFLNYYLFMKNNKTNNLKFNYKNKFMNWKW
uniref:ATP synthase complex subunit 8 n=1 Tax=Carabidae sp. BMNH 1274270 TaxID=1796499 RepID=A0A140EGC9_9CARA|nr:ATP synthase F0 subunit 8 [Carabidae sp. BMNH 1274270]